MQFEAADRNGDKYALLYPRFEENEDLKKLADDVGARGALRFDRKERAFRLYEARIPDGIDVQKVFGAFATPEAKEASKAQVAQLEEVQTQASRTLGASYDEAKLYYPARSNGDKDLFDEMRKKSETLFVYSDRAGAYIHKSGPTDGFERFQTPEAKAAWTENHKQVENLRESRRETAAQGVDVVAERANGREFLADNARGFLLPSTRQPEARQSQIDAMKSASNEEVAQVFKITQEEMRRLERKLYAIQLGAAQKATPDLQADEFNKMNPDKRREAAGFKGLTDDDYSRLVAVKSGFFGLRGELIDREVLQSVESAKAKQSENSTSIAGAGGKSEGKSAPSNSKEEPKPEAEKAKKQGQRMAAALAASGMGR